MPQPPSIAFGPFVFDPSTGRLCRGEQCLVLRSRAVAVLRYLVERPGDLVSSKELLRRVWGGRHVSRTVLRVCIHEIRAALGETGTASQYIETVGRQGYRFRSLPAALAQRVSAESPPLLGRQQELAQLHQGLQRALQGERQLVFVSGEVGIGKTALVDTFLNLHLSASGLGSGRGQCIENYGEGEPFLPLLEALGQLGRAPGGETLISILRQVAPTWLIHLPALVPETRWEQLLHQVQGATQLRMLRELAEALELLTAEAPLVLVFEDLHWSDPATLDALFSLAQRREPARLLLLGTCRLELPGGEEPLLLGRMRELLGRQQCVEVHLARLSTADVERYTAHRLGAEVAPELATLLSTRTEGNPLFLVTVLEHLLQQDLVVHANGRWTLRDKEWAARVLPENIRKLLSAHASRLPREAQQVLEAASVVGETFAVAAVAAAVPDTDIAVNGLCEGLARHGSWLVEEDLAGWPDGTISGHYRFRHALYRQVFYEGMSMERRMRLHRLVGKRLEQAYGDQSDAIAALLGHHCAQGQDLPRAVQYFHRAATNALQRSAPYETIDHCAAALELLPAVSDSLEAPQTELALHMTLGSAWIAAKGWATPEAEHAYRQAYVLCQGKDDPAQLFPVLAGLQAVHHMRAHLATTQRMGEQLLRLSQRTQEPRHLAYAKHVLCQIAAFQGHFPAARAHAEACLRLLDTAHHDTSALHYGVDPLVECRREGTWILWALGYPDQAVTWMQAALSRAQELDRPVHLAFALATTMSLHRLRREVAAAHKAAEHLIAFATRQDFALWVAIGMLHRGWALALQGHVTEGLSQLQQGLATYRATGVHVGLTTMLGMLAEVYGHVGRINDGLSVLPEALAHADDTGERLSESTLYQQRGALLLHQSMPTKAEACFHRALEVARQQHAKSLELQAAIRLSRFWQQHGKQEEARALLAPIYGWFTEGFDTADLQEAKALLDDLAG